MRIRRKIDDGVPLVVLEFADHEHEILRSLCDQYLQVLVVDGDDPAMRRLLPSAYRDDPEAAAEFARYTRNGLKDHKADNAMFVMSSLGEGPLRLDAAAVERWLPLLTDLRLVIAERLEIRSDADEIPESTSGDVYQWLGQLQQLLISAIDPESA